MCAIDAAGVLVAVHSSIGGVARGTPVRLDASLQRLALGTCAFGRALDARGQPLDDGPPVSGCRTVIEPARLSPRDREPVRQPFWTGVRAIDGLLTFGRGARIGIFGGPGAGKSTLLESIVEGCTADAVVIGLVGERGREAQRWIAALDHRTTVICATSDRAAAERARAAWVAAAAASALRRQGLHVLFVLDSLARVATAWRELALGAGESIGRGGFPPSVFADLARFIEVAGPTKRGSVTLVATVLDDGDERDPVSDAARSLLDGHVTLADRIAQRGRFPAIDVPASTSRTMPLVTGAVQNAAAQTVRSALALLERIEDARRLGIDPTDSLARRAIAAEEHLEAFLRQDRHPSEPRSTLRALDHVAALLNVETEDTVLPDGNAPPGSTAKDA